jgi:hypothetical protein
MTTLRAVWTRSAGAAERPSHWTECGGLLFRETGETGAGKTIRLQAAGILFRKSTVYSTGEKKSAVYLQQAVLSKCRRPFAPLCPEKKRCSHLVRLYEGAGYKDGRR